MKLYSNDKNVYEAAIDRIRYLYDEFPNVVVGYSGGKDSTVCFHLCMQVAKEKNRLPMKVLFIDQEAEWESTIEMVKEVMYHPDVDPYWYQMPMVITNNASSYERYSYCWDESKKDEWIHPKVDISKKVNRFGTDRFAKLFTNIFKVEFGDQNSCYISGVRTEETQTRFIGLTSNITYKWITWGKKLTEKLGHYTFYPLYDWSYSDVWKCIHDNNFKYNEIYDHYYQNGIPLQKMRVSNLHHETAVAGLLNIQEIEPQTWSKMQLRIEGVNAVSHLEKTSFMAPDELPPMFKDWREYTIYLADNLIIENKYKLKFAKLMQAKKYGLKYNDPELLKKNKRYEKKYWRQVINTILSSDWDFTKFGNFTKGQPVINFINFWSGHHEKFKWIDKVSAVFFSEEEVLMIMKKIKENNERYERENKRVYQ